MNQLLQNYQLWTTTLLVQQIIRTVLQKVQVHVSALMAIKHAGSTSISVLADGSVSRSRH